MAFTEPAHDGMYPTLLNPAGSPAAVATGAVNAGATSTAARVISASATVWRRKRAPCRGAARIDSRLTLGAGGDRPRDVGRLCGPVAPHPGRARAFASR